MMQSIAIPAVTQTRASGDYNPNDNNWQIGDSSILSHTLGLAPSKDVWSNHYSMHTIVARLFT